MKTYEFYQDNRYLYLVSEFWAGGELFDYIIANRCLTEPVAASIMSQLFAAVSYMHASGIIHRDLKPENLLLESKPTKGDTNLVIKVCDFGTGVLAETKESL